MRHEFTNDTAIAIPGDSKITVESRMQVSGISSPIRDVNVTMDLDHSWTNDLRIVLEAPDGTRVKLVEREGGSGNNFRNTTFDDAANRSIVGAEAPFSGTFQPEESLSLLDNREANGSWTLRVEDMARQDGGSLNSWQLSIEDSRLRLDNTDPVTIDAGPPSTVSSVIHAEGMGGVVVEDLHVLVDIEHSWDNDLTLRLKAPDGTTVVLVDRHGGQGDDFRQTQFSDDAPDAITDGEAPFNGDFRPQEPLAALRDTLVQGDWTLEVQDHARHDGGTLHAWSLEIAAKAAAPRRESSFSIEVEFAGGLTPSQRSVFELAAARWSEIIVGDLPNTRVGSRVIDDVLVVAKGEHIDGRSGVLGQAGPSHLRPDSLLPARGVMTFDSADLEAMEQDGSLVDVIIHEMGHVLGIGTLWEELKLLEGSGTDDPVFNGPAAMAEYAALRNRPVGDKVPVANTGGPGTREGHWRESSFGNELMTGFLNPGETPLSRLTIAALRDMGYEVNMDAADAFDIPDSMGLRMFRATSRHTCRTVAPKPEILPG
jgi:subtilisin-like proprotein convertase family protein